MTKKVATQGCMNQIVLRGRLGEGVGERSLPTGDTTVTFRVIVDREKQGRDGKSSDMIDCVALSAALRRKVLKLTPGIHIDLEGALRRRFFRSGGALISRYEVEVHSLTKVL